MEKQEFNYNGVHLITEESPNWSCNGCYFWEKLKGFKCSNKNLKTIGLIPCAESRPGIIFKESEG